MCVCAYVCVEGRSVASQIEIEGQDDGEKDDGSEHEDQDTVLDDPSQHAGEDARTLAQVGVRFSQPLSGFLDLLTVTVQVAENLLTHLFSFYCYLVAGLQSP